MEKVLVKYEQGDRLRVSMRKHDLLVDQPVADGGQDSGPTPTELFVAGLATCVGFYAERFLRRHALPTSGLTVECGFEFATDRPARVGRVDLRVVLPPEFPDDRRPGLQAVVEHCTVHNSITHAPEIVITLEPEAGTESIG